MSTAAPPSASKTTLKRIEQYKDRWSSFGLNTGIVNLSARLSANQLKKYEIFQSYPDKFLERISSDVSVAEWKKDSVLFEEGAYIDVAFFVLKGHVEVSLGPSGKGNSTSQPIFQDSSSIFKLPQPDVRPAGSGTMMKGNYAPPTATKSGRQITFLSSMDFNLPKGTSTKLGPGDFFGEIGALSGWPQSVTAKTISDCTLIQIRLPALRLMKHKSSDLKDRLDKIYKERTLSSQLKHTPLFAECDEFMIDRMRQAVDLVSLEPGEVVVREGEPHDAIYLVRSGFIKLSQEFGEGDLVVSYLSKGMTLGEVELLVEGLDKWEATASAVGYSELVKLRLSDLETLLAEFPAMQDQLWRSAAIKIKESGLSKRNLDHSEFTQVALETGLIQGNSALVIDLEVCTRCDDCVRACAATHQGRPRFVREGHKHANLEIPKSCYHCRDPVCLVGCPTGAIHRAGVGEIVTIDEGICIGCSTCANNCPYDAIVMHEDGGLWPDDMIPIGLRGTKKSVASKCDLCLDRGHGPACVINCPQGCATRIGSIDEFENLMSKEVPTRKRRRPAGRRSAFAFWAFVLGLLLCIAAYAANLVFGDEVRAGTLWGRGFGIAATVFLAGVAYLAVRRRTMKLSTKLRLGRTRTWLLFHTYGGVLFMLLVLMHSGFHLPQGLMSQWLLGLSAWTVASGLAGLGLQRWIPKMLASGLSVEVIYERIPELIKDLATKAETLARDCRGPVRALYNQRVAPALKEPKRRFIYFLDITGGIRSRLKSFEYLKSFLPSEEFVKLDRLEQLYQTKLEIDAHFTLQQALRWWLYAHVPPAFVLLALVAVHIFTVFYY